MKNEIKMIKKGEILEQTYLCCSETITQWEALNDAAAGQFVKLKRVSTRTIDYYGNPWKHEIIKRKVYCNYEGVLNVCFR
jgi:hypothetical protein